MEIIFTVLVVLGVSIVAFWAWKLIQLRLSIAKYRQYWQQRAHQDGEFVYMALGDSAAQGIGAPDVQKSYVARIASHIERVTGKTVRVMNISVSGATSSDVIKTQLEIVKNTAPDLVTLAIGGNDIKQYDRAVFEQNMKEILKTMPPSTVVADAPYFMHGSWLKHSKEMAGITSRIAEQHGLRIARLYDAMEAKGWNAMWNAYAADWFHPNARGYRTWFNAFWKEIEPMVSRNTQQR